MLSNKPLENLVFLAVKTASRSETFDSMPVILKGLFFERYRLQIEDLMVKPYYNTETNKTEGDIGLARATEIIYHEKAALLAEFGKVICIALGRIKDGALKTFVISGDDDKVLLETLIAKTPKSFGHTGALSKMEDHLVAHGMKHFHYPFLAKRMLLNNINLPVVLDLSDVKPWDMTFLHDTHEAWKMGQYDAYAGLPLLAEIFGIERTQESISGREIKDIYWKDKDLKKIEAYTTDDIWTLVNVYLKMKGMHNVTISK